MAIENQSSSFEHRPTASSLPPSSHPTPITVRVEAVSQNRFCCTHCNRFFRSEANLNNHHWCPRQNRPLPDSPPLLLLRNGKRSENPNKENQPPKLNSEN